MPRKGKRGPDGKRTPWYSRSAEKAHADAVAEVRSYCHVDPISGRTIVDCDALVGYFFQEQGFSLRISPGRDGNAWYKCGMAGEGDKRYYLLVERKHYESHTTALINLCEKVQEVLQGTLRPSPDVWHG